MNTNGHLTSTHKNNYFSRSHIKQTNIKCNTLSSLGNIIHYIYIYALCALLQASAGPPRAGVLLGSGPHSSVNIIRYPNLINDHFNFQIQSQQYYKSIKTTISIKTKIKNH